MIVRARVYTLDCSTRIRVSDEVSAYSCRSILQNPNYGELSSKIPYMFKCFMANKLLVALKSFTKVCIKLQTAGSVSFSSYSQTG